MTLPSDTYNLVADIGGTNTRVALAKGAQLLTETVTKYSNAEHAGLEDVLRAFMAAQGGRDCNGACVALAGPVRDGRGTMTNLDWQLDEATLARAAGAQTACLLNDLQAQGHALGHLPQGAVTQLVAPERAAADAAAAKLVVGVGTGFNIAPVHETPMGRYVPASESGHVSLPAHNETELRLAHFLEDHHGFPAVEDMLSGRGLSRVYTWLAAEAGTPRESSAAQIMQRFEDGSDAIAADATGMFVRMLGKVTGDLALIHLPFGGVFFAGGVARALSGHFGALGFVDAFRDKGRFAGFMGNFEVGVIEDDFAALTGCATYLAATGGKGLKALSRG